MDEIKKDDVIVTAFCFNCGSVVFAKLIPLRIACDPTAVCMECKSDDTEIISDRLGSEIEFLAETKKVKETEAAMYLNLLVMLGYEVFMRFGGGNPPFQRVEEAASLLSWYNRYIEECQKV